MYVLVGARTSVLACTANRSGQAVPIHRCTSYHHISRIEALQGHSSMQCRIVEYDLLTSIYCRLPCQALDQLAHCGSRSCSLLIKWDDTERSLCVSHSCS